MLGRADAKMNIGAKHWAVTGPGSLAENQLAIVLQFLREVELNDSMLMRPYLQVATICERHILESDGVLTLFRIIDRFNVFGNTHEIPPTMLAFTLVVSFRSGPMRGRLNLKIQPISPNQREIASMEFPILFEGDDERAANFVGQIQFQVQEEGLFWFSIMLEQEEYTRVPLRVVYQRQPTISAG
jgi:hypothetical protein